MNIVILDSGYKSYKFERSLFEGSGFTLKIHPSYKGDKTEKMAFAIDAHGILVRHTAIDTEFLSGMKNLKAVVRYGVGYDNIDIDACTRFGVKVANVQGYANHSVSDHALALLLTCSRGMWDPKKQINTQFAAPPVEDIFELHDKTLGIIGLGRIGSEFSKKATPLFREIIAADPYKPQHYFDNLNVRKTSLNELLQQSNVISVHCNLTGETTHLLNRETFEKMKKKPVIINTARGEVLDEKALLAALNTSQIHSAGLDVYENEPVTEAQEALVDHPRTICTGHYAWYSDRAAQELQKRAALNLFNLLTGKKTDDCLNPEI
ncbi:MAG: C-terminal binding protein [Mariniphaga sp.]|nr:C-terminal binding protein [Mariniphaga sp.]